MAENQKSGGEVLGDALNGLADVLEQYDEKDWEENPALTAGVMGFLSLLGNIEDGLTKYEETLASGNEVGARAICHGLDKMTDELQRLAYKI